MKQIQKQQAYLMQRDAAQARKEASMEMLIHEDLFNMVEDGIEAAWKKVMNRPSDEEFANRKGKGGGKGKSTPTRQERGIQDYLYKVYLVKAHPTHEEEMDP